MKNKSAVYSDQLF